MYESKPYSPPLPGIIQTEWRAPSEEEEEAVNLVEQEDVREDPIIPEPEGEEGEEDD